MDGFTFIDDLLQSALFPDGFENESGGERNGEESVARARHFSLATPIASTDNSHGNSTARGGSTGGCPQRVGEHCPCSGIRATSWQPRALGEPRETTIRSERRSKIKERAREELESERERAATSSAESYTGNRRDTTGL
jgi:hypothetical protein